MRSGETSRTTREPRLALPTLEGRLLRVVLPRAERDEIAVDLTDEFERRAAHDGYAAARRWLRRELIRSLPGLARWGWARSRSSYEPPANAYRPGGRMLRHWIADARYAARRLKARPGYLTIAVLTLALGIGGTAAVYGIARTLLFEPLPYADERTIGTFYFDGSWTEEEFSYLRGLYPKAALPGFRQVAMHRPGDVTLRESGDSPARLIPGLSVSAELFDVLGTRAMAGHTFAEGDDLPGAEPKVVLSYGLWQELGGASSIVGQRLTLDGAPRTVIGVMPRGFWYPSPDVRLWSAQPVNPEGRNGSFTLIGRALPGTDFSSLAAPLAQLTKTLDDRFDYPSDWDKTKGAAVTPVRDKLLGPMRPALVATLAAMGLILLIACANVAALMLGQVEARETELAVRSALGANRTRLTQQLVVEALLVGLAAGTVGSLLALAGFRLLAGALPLGAWGENATFDWTMFATAMVLAIAAVLLVTLAPATSLWRGDLRGALGSLRTGGIQGRGGRLERGLVVAEVALAMLIAAGAALLVRSVNKLYAIDPGVRTEGVAVIDALASAELRSPERKQGIAEVVRALEGMPGVQGAAAAMKIPLRGSGNSFGMMIPGRETRDLPTTYFRVVTPGYFSALGFTVREGRTFDVSDRPDSVEIAVVVNEALAKRFFPNESALGKIVGGGYQQRQRIVGVVRDASEGGLTDQPFPTRYYLADQVPWWGGNVSFVVRTQRVRDAEELLDRTRAEINRIAPLFAVQATTTMSRVFDVAIGPARQVMSLLTLLSALALVLGAVGIYGVISHFAARRKRDWAIRIALGLPTWRVVQHVVGEGAALVGIGVVLGAIGTASLVRVLASFLYGIGSFDPIAFTAAALVMLATGVVAAFIPAQRAGRVAPAKVLREQ